MFIKKFLSAVYNIFLIARGRGVDFSALPEEPKSFWARYLDLWAWYFKYGEVMSFYYILGFASKSRKEQNEYISAKKYYKLLEKISNTLVSAGEPLNYRVLTFDKYVSNNYMQSIGVPVARNEALILNNRVLWSSGGEGGLDSLLKAGFESLYIKPVYGSFGLDIMRLELEAGGFFYKGERLATVDLEKRLAGKLWVVQKKVAQHDELGRFNNSAANTLRVVTMLNAGEPEHVTSIMRFSTGKSHVDNWDAGALAIGVHHPEGVLWDKAFFKPKRFVMDAVSEHPDSKIAFKGFKIPFYREAVESALRVHRFYYARFVLAHDIAITNEGPVIIEVNCNPGHRTIQITSGGLKKRISRAQSKRNQK